MKVRLLAKMLAEDYMSALGPQRQIGTPPIGGRKMAVMFQLAFEERPSGEELLLFCHTHRRSGYYCQKNLILSW